MPASPLHSSERQDWQSPEWLLERVRRVGPIVLDPATAPNNPTRALHFYSQQKPTSPVQGTWLGPCGLAGTWTKVGLIWVNSPYGPHLDGAVQPEREVWRKINGVLVHVGTGTGWAARIAMHDGERISLTPNRTEVEWFEMLHASSRIRAEFRKRIPFVDAATGEVGAQPNHGSVLFYNGPNGGRFIEAFSDIARIIPGGRRAA